METTPPVNLTSVAEKLRAMEALWAGSSRDEAQFEPPRGMAMSCTNAKKTSRPDGNRSWTGRPPKSNCANGSHENRHPAISPRRSGSRLPVFRTPGAIPRRIFSGFAVLRHRLAAVIRGFTRKLLAITGCCPNGFPMPFTTRGIRNRFRQSHFGLPRRFEIPSPSVAVNRERKALQLWLNSQSEPELTALEEQRLLRSLDKAVHDIDAGKGFPLMRFASGRRMGRKIIFLPGF